MLANVNASQKKAFIFIALVIAICLGLYLSHAFKKDTTLRWRVKQMADFSRGSGSARMHYWRAAIEAIKEKPWFGYGLENQDEAFAPRYRPEWAKFIRAGNYPDRAHNIILDTLLTGGIVGLAALSLLYYAFFRVVISNIRNGKEAGLSLAILASGSGYITALLFGFPVITTEVYFFGLFAMAAAINSDYIFGKQMGESVSVEKTALLKIVLAAVLGSVALFFGYRQIKLLQADHYYLSIQKANQDSQLFTAITLYDYIKESGADRRGYAKRVGGILAEWAWRLGTRPEQHVTALELEKIYESFEAKRFDEKVLKAKIESALYVLGRPEYFEPAVKSYQEVIVASPYIPQLHRELARLYLENKQYKEAESELDIGISLMPKILTKEYGPYQREAVIIEKYRQYSLKGDLYFAQKAFDPARDSYGLAFSLYEKDLSLLKKMGASCEAVKNHNCALKYYEKGSILNPNDPDWDRLIKQTAFMPAKPSN